MKTKEEKPLQWLGATGSKIREKRLELGMRQALLAETVGISPSYLNLIEHNRRRIGGKLLHSIARALSIEPSVLNGDVDPDLLQRLHRAAATYGGNAEVSRSEDLISRYPGWSGLIADLAEQVDAMDARIKAQNDRMSYDPQLSASLHELISAVTSIRSSASILVGQEELDTDWQRRFNKNIHADSVRLALSSEALMAQLENPIKSRPENLSPRQEVDAFLQDRDFFIAELEEAHVDVSRFCQQSGLSPAGSQQLLDVARTYVADAKILPRREFDDVCHNVNYDPIAISSHFSAPFGLVLRRMTTLQPKDGHPPTGFASCDASGALLLSKPIAGFSFRWSAGSCPLWPIYRAFAQPGQPIRADVALPDAAFSRMRCYAIAEPNSLPDYGQPPTLRSAMLVLTDVMEPAQQTTPIGLACHICSRNDCSSRREPAILGIG